MNDKVNSLTSTDTKISLSLEDVTTIIQKLREDQVSFLEQQREVIIQQVLQSIQHSGVLGTATLAHNIPKPKSKAKSPFACLEQSLHNLVHHSLAESGLEYPHVHNTAHEAKAQSVNNYRQTSVGERPTKSKQIILSRQEVEGGDSTTTASSARSDVHQEQDQQQEKDQHGRIRDLSCSLAHSPLSKKQSIKRKKRVLEATSRQHHRYHNVAAATTCRSHVDQGDEDYSMFVDPVDAAFGAIRKQVDRRTLAILDRSKALLRHVKQQSSTEERLSFVDKLRQRHAKQATTSAEKVKPSVDDNEPVEQVDEREVSTKRECKESDTEMELKPGHALRMTADDLRCDLELLQPPSKAPDNDNEWENELARQILTIYATSIKAKQLEKAEAEQEQNVEQHMSKTCRDADNKQRVSSGSTESLKPSCSLPIIRSKTPSKHRKEHSRSSYSPTTVHYSWEPSQLQDDGKVVINMPKVPRPIWFAGTGAVKAVWCALADGFRPQHEAVETSVSSAAHNFVCNHRLCEEVRQLEAKKKFAQCIITLETLLVALVRARGANELETRLWKQLVVTCNAFASRCIDYRKFPASLQLMKQAEHLIDNYSLVDNTTKMELLAYLYDTYAHYYYKRRKPHAGLQYILKAHEIHKRQSSWSHLAKCRLHIANLLSYQSKHTEAIKHMVKILEMIEENKLEEGGVGSGSAQKLCLAAVCYNNLAVEQLHMREFEAASISTANAQRLAKLCLSYSNRWLAQFEATSDCVDLAMVTLMETTDNGTL